MAATTNSAVKSFLDQRTSDVGASSLSALIQALQDRTVAADLASNSANVALLEEVLRRLLAVANDDAKGTASRLMCLEGFYHISAGASDAVRQGTLFLYVQQLNESFDAMVEREAEVLDGQREMLTVLLLRCTGYTKLKAGDVLQQLCRNDDSQLVGVLITMLRNTTYEWPLIQAALRWLYELTTPATYFTAETATETTKVHAFQAKVADLLEGCVRRNTINEVLHQLVCLWQRFTESGLAGGLGRCDTITGVTVLSSAQQCELLQWAVVIRYVSVLVHNLSEFSGRPDMVREMQQSLVAGSQTFLAEVLVPFTMAAIHAWERERAASRERDSAAVAESRDPMQNPFLNAAIAALQLLRFALYRSAPSPPTAAGGGGGPKASPGAPAQPAALLKTPLLTSLLSLIQFSTCLEPTLKQEYPGMLVLLMVVQCCCNANAVLQRGAPVNLASAFEVLVETIASDKAAIRADSPYGTALAFAICFNRGEAPFVETQNESARLVHAKLNEEEAALKEDAETLDAIHAMQEQLEYLQAVIMQAALSQLLAELGTVSFQLGGIDGGHLGVGVGETSNPLLGNHPSSVSPAESPATRKKKAKRPAHPEKYRCQLTGKLMREPVVLRNGHRFEYDALMDVVQRVGHVDPLTGEDVNEEFEVDVGLMQDIADYRVARAAKK